MVIKTRIYKTYDPDLLALLDAGLPLADMMRTAVRAYVHGDPCHILIDQPLVFRQQMLKTVVITVTFGKADGDAFRLFDSIRPGYRSTFLKCILRNALVQQNLTAFFKAGDVLDYQGRNLASFNLADLPGLILLSEFGSAKTGNVMKKKKAAAGGEDAEPAKNVRTVKPVRTVRPAEPAEEPAGTGITDGGESEIPAEQLMKMFDAI